MLRERKPVQGGVEGLGGGGVEEDGGRGAEVDAAAECYTEKKGKNL